MTPTLILLILAGVLFAAGMYLVTDRPLTRIVIGLALMANGANILVLACGGAAGVPPILGSSEEAMTDPIPQALVLTSIVISLGTTAFGMAMAYRSWRLSGHDEVADDVEDRRLSRRAALARSDARANEESDETETFVEYYDDERNGDDTEDNDTEDSGTEDNGAETAAETVVKHAERHPDLGNDSDKDTDTGTGRESSR